MRKNLSEIMYNEEEMIKVLEANTKLQRAVEDDLQESEMYFIDDVIRVLKAGLNDWEIGFNNYNYLSIDSAESFLEALKEANNDYGVLDDEGTELLNEALEMQDDLESIDIYEDKRCYELEEKIDEAAETLRLNTLEFFNGITDGIDAAAIQEYFIDCYIDNIDVEDFVYDTETYILYQTIIKSWE